MSTASPLVRRHSIQPYVTSNYFKRLKKREGSDTDSCPPSAAVKAPREPASRTRYVYGNETEEAQGGGIFSACSRARWQGRSHRVLLLGGCAPIAPNAEG